MTKAPTTTKVFAVNDTVLVRHGVQIYDARVLRLDPDSATPQYFVHYLKWSKKWDEWVGPERVLDTSEASRTLQKQAKDDAENAPKGAAKKRLAANGPLPKQGASKKHKVENPFEAIKVEGSHELEDLVAAVDVQIPIPIALKKILVDDWKNVTQQERWIELPRKTPVSKIIDDFLTQGELSEKQVTERESTKEIIKGLVTYFNKAVGCILLYRDERPQYDMILAAHPETPLATIYGGEHLLRLFARLPLLVSCVQASLSAEDSRLIQATMVQLLKFLQKRKQQYFLPAYTDASTFTLPTEEESAKAEEAAPEVTAKPAPKKKGGKKAPAKKSAKANGKAKKAESNEADEKATSPNDGQSDGEKPTVDAVEGSESADAAEKVDEATEEVATAQESAPTTETAAEVTSTPVA
ncbi:hypothetical protein SDRG_11822 [Saprolegnia diclina VS20]|uniref:Uncharacterized protein n=1 Tax=Saprolegnia diclina (strain VS20) TaxID=1156394 RepID=T0Q7E1_SAPDV|nr:hypothetical protein SDRG_11822 [Saprolegnia diclina VS20]EQC30506.1 hypothetical protein SDRG_11822 [Saprolegnia diclina VS20]|eukprot:XP_008616099.1 hypothetical protein SDRG_11822 [Saprolegnia diclina VS20]